MASITLASNGTTDWTITLVPPPTPPLAFALSELRKYLHQITGCEFPLAEPGAASPTIFLNIRKNLCAPHQASLPAPASGYDGYSVSIIPSNPFGQPCITIAGDNERGVIYGVYDLLERIGCRWFYPALDERDPEVVPKLETIELPVGEWSVASPVKYRLLNASGMIYTVTPEMAKKQTDAAMKQRYNGMAWQCETKTDLKEQYDGIVSSGLMEEIKKRGMCFQGPLHCFHYFLTAEEHFEKHPEWFGMRDGQRRPHVFGGAQFCWSNADARKVFVDNVEKFVLACPEMDILSMCALDGGQACECPECSKLNPSDSMLLLFNELAERLAKSSPHVALETYGGYPPVQDPPKQVKMHPSLRLFWAHWGRYHGMGYDDLNYGYKDNLDTWRNLSKGHGFSLCQYYTDHFAEPWIAAPYAIAVEGDRKYMLENDVDGIYMLQYPEGYWWNYGLNTLLGAKPFFDISLNPFELVRDYGMTYYGRDAGPLMAAYFEEWARNVDLAYQVRGGSTEATRAKLAEQRAKYIRPAMAATENDPVLSYRMGKVAKLHAFAERLMEIQRRQEEIARLRKSGNIPQAKQAIMDAQKYAEETKDYVQSLIDLNQGLIDPQLLSFFFSRIQASISQELESLESGATPQNQKREPEINDMIPDEAR